MFLVVTGIDSLSPLSEVYNSQKGSSRSLGKAPQAEHTAAQVLAKSRLCQYPRSKC